MTTNRIWDFPNGQKHLEHIKEILANIKDSVDNIGLDLEIAQHDLEEQTDSRFSKDVWEQLDDLISETNRLHAEIEDYNAQMW